MIVELAAAALVASAGVQLHVVHTLAKRLDSRDVALYKQQKEIRRESERVRIEAGKAVEHARNAAEDARLTNQRAQELLSDPGLKRILNRG